MNIFVLFAIILSKEVISMTFSNNIKFLRLKHDLSQEDLANKLGYKSLTTIAKWESGVAEPPIKIVKKLAEMFDVRVSDLINNNLTDIEQKQGYYFDDEAAQMAQELFDREELRVLFDASRNVSKKDIEDVAAILEKLKQR